MPNNVRIHGSFDIDRSRAKAFSQKFNCQDYRDIEALLDDKAIDFVIISTIHSELASLAKRALEVGLHVFIEKPGARTPGELREVVELAKRKEKKLHIGYNHDFHPGIRKAINLIEADEIGQIMYLRGRYGHGGRIGYDNEWRSKKEISGGGELIDQGAHLLGITLKLLGDVSLLFALTPTFFWKMEVEDNAFIVLEDRNGRVSLMHASCTEWKNLFSFEVFGTKGKIEVNGLGGSYGIETLTHYKMLPEMGPPVETYLRFDSQDESWRLELCQFVEDIENDTNIANNTKIGVRILEIVEEIYKRTNR